MIKLLAGTVRAFCQGSVTYKAVYNSNKHVWVLTVRLCLISIASALKPVALELQIYIHTYTHTHTHIYIYILGKSLAPSLN